MVYLPVSSCHPPTVLMLLVSCFLRLVLVLNVTGLVVQILTLPNIRLRKSSDVPEAIHVTRPGMISLFQLSANGSFHDGIVW